MQRECEDLGLVPYCWVEMKQHDCVTVVVKCILLNTQCAVLTAASLHLG